VVHRVQAGVLGASVMPHAPRSESVPSILTSVVFDGDFDPAGGVRGIGGVVGGNKGLRRAIAVQQQGGGPGNGAGRDNPIIE